MRGVKMAASVARRSSLTFCRAVHNHCSQRLKDNTLRNRLIAAASITATVSLYIGKTRLQDQPPKSISTNLRVHAKELETETQEASPKRQRTTYREVRFKQFASVEYEGIVFMTPQDFLESVTEQIPRPRIGRVKLSSKDVESMLKSTPPRSRGSGKLFRRILDKGIISYTEYLFLLCVLTKPQSGFKIAFKMFDTDGNQIVDKREFLVLKKLFGLSHDKKNKMVVSSRNELKPLKDLVSLEEVFSSASGRNNPEDKMVGEQETSESPITDTTLLVHFFGQKGKEVLRFEDFRMFMENLQSEVLELEFKEFSKGMPTISEVDFARILLRYTLLDRSEINECVERVRERVPHEKNGSQNGPQGITFKEFKQFCTFLNNLDDFAITMNMYALAGKPISPEDFQRAVKVCTGYTLEPHIVRTVFIIFDEDGDGHLSHQEFISIMKDRLHRGSRSYLMHSQSRWEAFRSCVKNEMKSN